MIKRVLNMLVYILLTPLVIAANLMVIPMSIIAIIKYIIYGYSKGDPEELCFICVDAVMYLHFKINRLLNL